MKLKVGSKNYDLNFGIGFVRNLDKYYGVSVQGMSFGMGLTQALSVLRVYDPDCLSEVLYIATWSDASRPTQEAFDRVLEDDNTDIEKLFDDVVKELATANATKIAVKNLQAQMRNH